jgi:hypothetical protein
MDTRSNGFFYKRSDDWLQVHVVGPSYERRWIPLGTQSHTKFVRRPWYWYRQELIHVMVGMSRCVGSDFNASDTYDIYVAAWCAW